MGLGFWEVVETAYQGYFLACLVPGLLLPLGASLLYSVKDWPLVKGADLTAGNVIGMFFLSFIIVGLCFVAALILALPGFVVLRGLMFWARVKSALGFAMAGILAAIWPAFVSFAEDPALKVDRLSAESLASFIAWAALGALVGLVSWRGVTRFLGATPSSASPAKVEAQP